MHLSIDPVAFQLSGIAIRWYGLCFATGLAGVWLMMRALAKAATDIEADLVDRLMFWLSLGAFAGGRIGDLAFFDTPIWRQGAARILSTADGGMSFHGGLIGVAAALALFAASRRIDVLKLSDLTACATPFGLLLGRIGNFLNGEIFGPPTALPWGVAFPAGGPAPRHPTQLYEALLEGLAPWIILYGLAWRGRLLNRSGLATGLFLASSALARIFIEPWRADRSPLPWIAPGLTEAQALCLPMLALAGLLLARARRRAGEDRCAP